MVLRTKPGCLCLGCDSCGIPWVNADYTKTRYPKTVLLQVGASYMFAPVTDPGAPDRITPNCGQCDPFNGDHLYKLISSGPSGSVWSPGVIPPIPSPLFGGSGSCSTTANTLINQPRAYYISGDDCGCEDSESTTGNLVSASIPFASDDVLINVAMDGASIGFPYATRTFADIAQSIETDCGTFVGAPLPDEPFTVTTPADWTVGIGFICENACIIPAGTDVLVSFHNWIERPFATIG